MNEIDLFTAREGGYRCYRIPGLVVSTRGTVVAFREARPPQLQGRRRRTRDRGEEMEHGATDDCEAVELNDGTVYMTMRSGGPSTLTQP